MERKKVTSSMLASVGYDAATETLEVQFHNNKYVYCYVDVPMTVALQMSQAESMGRFYLKEIKPNFKCTRIEEKREDQPKVEAEVEEDCAEDREEQEDRED